MLRKLRKLYIWFGLSFTSLTLVDMWAHSAHDGCVFRFVIDVWEIRAAKRNARKHNE